MQTIYRNGTILTMESPRPVEAVLTENGRIAAVGGEAEVLAAAHPDAEYVDLEGLTMLPAFLDAHSHLAAAANARLQAPLGECVNFSEIEERIKSFLDDRRVPAGQWIVASGYDHNQLEERRHPPVELLDRIAPDNPLVLSHASGHVGVFNHAALQQAGISEQTPNPEGGVIGRENGRLNGYLEESAYIGALRRVPMPSERELLDAMKEAQRDYASHGITTVQEGMFVSQLVPLYRALLRDGGPMLDVVGYVDFKERETLCAAFSDYLRRYRNRLKIGGYKIFLDGSPQGRTAWMRTPYLGSRDDYGYPAMSGEEVEAAVRTSHEDGMQLLAHCNGDAACGQYLDAVEAVENTQGSLCADRPVMVHAQLLGLDQLRRVHALSLIPSFFVAHVYHWGDVHVRNFGLPRAAQISPAASALRRAIPFTFHQDTPVIEPDMLETVWCAVCRRTRSGELLGAQERIGVYDALRAVTANAAYQYFEEREKGTITPGKRADFVILSGNPLAVEPEQIRELRVIQTIREGEAIYCAQ